MREPKHTCPDIDKIIRSIKDADDNLRYALRRLYDVKYCPQGLGV
jgi:hypothetical protein